MKLATQGNVVEMTGIIHRFRGQVWKRAVRSGHKLRSALCDMWLDVDSTVDGVYGNQEGAEEGYNPHKKGQKAYHPVIAFVAETKEILHRWFRCGSAYTSNGIVEFMKECMAYTKRRVRVIVREGSGFFFGRVVRLPGVSISGIPYQGGAEGSGWFARRESAGGSEMWEQANFMHKCGTWNRARRFVAVRKLIKIERKLFDIPVLVVHTLKGLHSRQSLPPSL
ncbi:MAG: tnpA 9 [Candidatus Brocadiaceae bacterium]|nr:tnpA 9 [Candidatus Brocadiaceae bacterium]